MPQPSLNILDIPSNAVTQPMEPNVGQAAFPIIRRKCMETAFGVSGAPSGPTHTYPLSA